MKYAMGWALALSLGAAHAAEVPNETAAGIVRMAASMNEMALACQHLSAAEIDTAKAKQKSSAVADFKIRPSDFDKLYTQAADDFKKQWASVPAAQQKQTCDQMKSLPQSAS